MIAQLMNESDKRNKNGIYITTIFIYKTKKK